MLNKKALAASVSAPPAEYVEDVFSTYLYTGTSASQTITNNIDLSGEGGMVWIKNRSNSLAFNHVIQDSERGFTTGKKLSSNLTVGQNGTNITDNFGYISGATSSGFTLDKSGSGSYDWFQTNASDNTYVSWTFRKAPKFFDVVTYTGDNTSNRSISHNLGSTPGMIIVKSSSNTGDWFVWHRSLGADGLLLQTTDAKAGYFATQYMQNSTSTIFKVNDDINFSGRTYVAYLFAHNAGGFGTAGTDNVISCGSYTGTGAEQFITLGYEPQYVMIKRTDTTGDWFLHDIMRGADLTDSWYLRANTSGAEQQGGVPTIYPTATGFSVPSYSGWGASGGTYIYMAIRRPMKTPTSGTEVFSVTTGNFTTPKTVTTNFPVDLCYSTRTGAGTRHFNDRLRGGTTTSYRYLATNSTAAESTGTSAGIGFDNNTAIIDNDWVTGADAVWWNFKRATGFFDVVCYTGTGSNRTVAHNLGVAPELMIVKSRDVTRVWAVYNTAIAALDSSNCLALNTTDAAFSNSTYFNSTAPTSTVFTVGTDGRTNASAEKYVAYLFATVAGVSKVGSYTGTGSTQTINCGFTAGARFVMIKRTDSTGDWYIYDTARGIVSGNDPFLLANTSTAQTTNTDYIDPANSGFEISSTAPAAINANGGSYIFLAIS